MPAIDGPAVTDTDRRSGVTQPPGLRERSKAKRRAAIQRAAARLFAEKGFDQTTIVEIAEAAEVAPRTVSGYFPSKVEIATSISVEIATRLTDSVTAHPDADLLDIVDRWLTVEEELYDAELMALLDAMYEANPQLSALSNAQMTEAGEIGRTAIATRIGVPVDHPMVRIVTDAFSGAVGGYFAALAQHGPDRGLHEDFIRYLAAVLDPNARPA